MSTSSNIINVTEGLSPFLEKNNVPVLVDFWAPWCGPCISFMPTIQALANKFVGVIQVGKLNIDEQEEEARAHKVKTIPTLILFDKDNNEIMRIVGRESLDEIVQKIETSLLPSV